MAPTPTAGRAGAAERIVAEVTSWPGVSVEAGRFGAVALVLGRRELGHLHGDAAAHFAFPRPVRAELVAAGRVGPHPALPHSPGLAARRIDSADDEREVVALMRLNYDRMVARHGAAPAA